MAETSGPAVASKPRGKVDKSSVRKKVVKKDKTSKGKATAVSASAETEVSAALKEHKAPVSDNTGVTKAPGVSGEVTQKEEGHVEKTKGVSAEREVEEEVKAVRGPAEGKAEVKAEGKEELKTELPTESEVDTSASMSVSASVSSESTSLNENPDYIALTSALSMLTKQQRTSKKDLVTLSQLRQQAVESPEEFLQQLKSAKMTFPKSLHVAMVPQIDWDQYDFDNSALDAAIQRQMAKESQTGVLGEVPLFNQ